MGKQPSNTDVQFWRDPDLPGVEMRRSFYTKEVFRKHSHAEYSIAIIEDGRSNFYREGEICCAVKGHLALIEPGVIHNCNPDTGSGVSYRLFYVNAKWVEDVAAEVFGQEPGAVVFPTPVLDDKKQFNLWYTLSEAIINGASRLEKESLLVAGLAGLITVHGEMKSNEELSKDSEAVMKAKEYLADNLSKKVSLEELAEVAHMSRYHFLRVFQDEVGLPPHTYQNQIRVEESKRLLNDGLPISQVAVNAGFVDQSHFSRVFKTYTGATPKQYQTDHSLL